MRFQTNEELSKLLEDLSSGYDSCCADAEDTEIRDALRRASAIIKNLDSDKKE